MFAYTGIVRVIVKIWVTITFDTNIVILINIAHQFSFKNVTYLKLQSFYNGVASLATPEAESCKKKRTAPRV